MFFKIFVHFSLSAIIFGLQKLLCLPGRVTSFGSWWLHEWSYDLFKIGLQPWWLICKIKTHIKTKFLEFMTEKILLSVLVWSSLWFYLKFCYFSLIDVIWYSVATMVVFVVLSLLLFSLRAYFKTHTNIWMIYRYRGWWLLVHLF